MRKHLKTVVFALLGMTLGALVLTHTPVAAATASVTPPSTMEQTGTAEKVGIEPLVPADYLQQVEDGLQKNKSNMLSLFLFISRSMTQDPAKYGVEQSEIAHLFSTAMLYDLAFKKDSALYGLLMGQIGSGEAVNTGNYPGTVELNATATNQEDGQPMKLHAYYVDQGSDKTVVIHGGYRGNWENGIKTTENDEFYNAGYNLLCVDSRATGESGGQFITFGYYESDDVLYWINREVSARPQQQILLYGGSMGASTMMSALAKPHPANIKGIIENCGFASIEGQLRSTYNMVAGALGGEDLAKYFGKLDIVPDQAHQDMYINLIKTYYTKQLNMPLDADLPVKGMQNTLPKLIIHGAADDFVPTQNAYDLANQAAGYVRTFIVPNAGHGDAIRVDPIGYHKQVQDFLNVVFDAHVTVRYQIADGQLLHQTPLSGTYGDDFHTQALEFKGYTFDHVMGTTKGVFNETHPVVTYVYRAIGKPVQGTGSKTELTRINERGATKSKAVADSKQGNSLPKTGDRASVTMLVGGVLITIVSFGGFLKRIG